MTFLKHPAALAVVLCSALAACDAGPMATDPAPLAPSAPLELARMQCNVTVATGAMQCGDALSTGAASGVILGNQNVRVRLAASNHTYDSQNERFTIDVTVQNLIGQAMGTTDGSTLDPKGVMVFFHTEPYPTSGDLGGDVELAGAVERDFILRANQAYFQYDEVIQPNAVSAPVQWDVDLPTAVGSFAFTVYVMGAVQHPNGWVDLSVGRDTLLEGDSVHVSAVVRDVYGDPVADPISWASSDPAVATVDNAGALSAHMPGSATVTATAGTRSGQLSFAVCPDLAVGEVYTASMPGASSVCFAGAAGAAAEYTYMPVNLSTSSALSLTLTGTNIQAVTGPPSPALLPGGGPRLAVLDAEALRSGDAAHLARLERDRAQLSRLAAPRLGGGARRAITPGVPAVDDLWSLNVAQDCGGALDLRTGRVRSVGTNVIIVSDTANPAGGFTTAQYDSIRLEFDTIAYPVITSNFGTPSDIDSNARVVLFFTRALNELSPPASSLVVEAQFRSRDLYDAGTCARSNVGEILYMMVPDPTGSVNSNVRTVSFVRGSVIRNAGHELQHLVNAARRVHVQGTNTLEEPWLDEGLSGIAEELMFYRTAAGLAPRQNIALTNLTTGPNASRRVAAFNTYANGNYTRLRSWLQRPDTAGAFKDNVSLTQRGASWSFLRYAVDRVNGTESAFWASLTNTTLTGKANLQAALGADPDAWLRDFTAGIYADDAVAVATQYQHPSWNYRSVFGGLGGVPIGTRPLTNATPLTLSYSRGGGTAYARFGVPAGGFASLTALSGGVAPTSPYALIVVRTK